MATTPQGDAQALRKAIVRNLARKVAQQQAGQGSGTPSRRRKVRPLTARPMPVSGGARA